MHFARVPMLFCLLYYATLCFATINYYRRAEFCYEQHLKENGKLSETYESKAPPVSDCNGILGTMYETELTYLEDKAKNMFPNQSNVSKCLKDEFKQRKAVDHIRKIILIKRNRFLSVSAKDAMLDEARFEFKDELKKMADRCVVDDKTVIQIYNDQLGIKNETLVAYQHQYCMAKYVVDNQIIQVDNVDINPHHIDTDSINCVSLLAIERETAENDLKNHLIASQFSQRRIDCILNVSKTNDVFGHQIAFKLLHFYFAVPDDVIETENNKAQEKFIGFIREVINCRQFRTVQ